MKNNIYFNNINKWFFIAALITVFTACSSNDSPNEDQAEEDKKEEMEEPETPENPKNEETTTNDECILVQFRLK